MPCLEGWGGGTEERTVTPVEVGRTGSRVEGGKNSWTKVVEGEEIVYGVEVGT